MPPGDRPLALQLWNAAQVMGIVFDEYLAVAGGSRYHFFVFVALKQNPGASQRVLAEAVGVDDATITHHLTAMERAGLIARTRAPEDRRIQRVALTDSGEGLRDALNAAVDRYNADQFRGISAEEQAVVLRVLAQMNFNSERCHRSASTSVDMRRRRLRPCSAWQSGQSRDRVVRLACVGGDLGGPRFWRDWTWSGRWGRVRCAGEAVANVRGQRTRERLVDLRCREKFDIGCDVVVGGEVERLLGFADTTESQGGDRLRHRS